MEKQHQENPKAGQSSSIWKLILNIFIVAAIVLAVNFVFKMSQPKTQFQWRESSLTVSDPDGVTYTVDYADINAIQLVEECDFGVCKSGGETKHERYGVWTNELWGDYQLYCSTAFDRCIVLYTSEGVFVMNCETAETTAALYDSVLQIFSDGGYVVDILPAA